MSELTLGLTTAQCEEIAETVAGSCQSHYANDLLEGHGLCGSDLREICASVEVFECPQCNWWGHQGEILMYCSNETDENVCQDCAEEHEE